MGGDKLSEKWPWNGEFLRLFLLMPSVVGLTATIATYPFAGIQCLWFLTAIPVGVLLYMVYRAVGRRVEKLENEFQDQNVDMAEALMVIGKIHSPGIVVLRGPDIELLPIVGKRQTISLGEMPLIGEGRWLPGKFVWGKRVFTFDARVFRPLAFAVPEPVGARWSPLLEQAGTPRGER